VRWPPRDSADTFAPIASLESAQPVYASDPVARRFAALVDLGLERVDVVPVETEAFPVGAGRWQVMQSRPAMGTRVSITAVAESQARAVDGFGRAFEEMDRLIGLLNRYDPRSALSDLNASGRIERPPPELHRLLREARRFHRWSRGAFDVTVAPLLAVFRAAFAGAVPREPADAEVREALSRVGERYLAVSRRRVTLARDGMAVTLDGIAKGHIVDAMAGVLDRHGLRHHLIDAGGDIRVRGNRETGTPWTVAVRDPASHGLLPDVVQLDGGAIATSGSYEIHFDDDLAFHHIVDAATGRSPGATRSVSVRAPTTLTADALATGIFVLGPAAGVALVDGLRGVACLVVDRDGRQWKSRRWRSLPFTDQDEAGP